jgi:hypothetical protein
MKMILRRLDWLLALALWPAMASAQQAPRFDVFGGYSYVRVANSGSSANTNGWEAAAALNFNRFVGVAADFGGSYWKVNGVNVNQTTFLVGPQVTFRQQRFDVYIHGLAGAARLGANGFGLSASSTKLAAAFGGGLNVRAGEHLSVRVVQADYLLTRFGNITQNDVRLSAGLVFHF